MTYEVDLNEDGQPDEAGPLGLGVSVSYRFDTPGVHAMPVIFQRGSGILRVETMVVVNDTMATEVLAAVTFPESELEGIVLDRAERTLYVGDSRGRVLRILDTSDALRERSVISLPPTDRGFGVQGMALSNDESLLYVDSGDSLVAIRLINELLIERLPVETEGTLYVEPSDDETLYLAGFEGVKRVDPTGNVVSKREIQGSGHLAVSPDGAFVALLQRIGGPGLRLLDAQTLSESWHTSFSDDRRLPQAVTFTPDGKRLYVLLGEDDFYLLVLDATTGRILRDIVVAHDAGGRAWTYHGLSNPVAISADRRYVVFATGLGAFFIDTSSDLPRFRTVDHLPDGSIGCCNVAASRVSNVFFFSNGRNGAVFSVRLNP